MPLVGGNIKKKNTAILENSLGVSCKLNIYLPYDPVITLLGTYLRKMKTYVYTKSCTQLFTEALFVIAPN